MKFTNFYNNTFITELFQTKASIKWDESSEENIYGRFTAPNGRRYGINFEQGRMNLNEFLMVVDESSKPVKPPSKVLQAFKSRTQWHLHFYDLKHKSPYGVTGVGGEMSVFGIIINGLIDILSRRSEVKVFYVDARFNRISLYRKICNLIAPKIGWNIIEYVSSGLAENKNEPDGYWVFYK